MKEAVIVSGVRTAVGNFGGALQDVPVVKLGAIVIREALKRAGFRPKRDAQVLSYAPKDRAILLEIAELHRQLNQPQRALQTLQTLADTYSPGEEPGHVLYLTGLAYTALGRYDEGRDSLAAAVKRERPTAEMLCRLGEVELVAGHSAAALDAARQALNLEPRHQPSRELLGRIKLAQQPRGTVR